MRKKIENIFSKSDDKQKQHYPNIKTKIIIDSREKQSLVTANLVEQKANISHELLEIGDYLIQDTIIERKTISDFINSIIDKRIYSQLNEIKKYPKYFLIVEGFFYEYNKFNIHENAIRGMFLSIAIDFKIPIIFTKDEEDTAKFLILTAKKYEKTKHPSSIREKKTLKTTEEQKRFILEGFPGIGPVMAKKLIQKFGSLKNIFNKTEKELEEIGKLDKNKIKSTLYLLEN